MTADTTMDTIDPDAPAYDWLTLDEGEIVEWAGQPHAYSLIPAFVVGVPLTLIIIGLFIIAGAYLTRENTDYVITSDALYVKRGILSRDVKRVGYEKVQNTSYTQDLFGKQFGYGHVDISTAGGAGIELQFRSVPEPKAVQERINAHIRGPGADRDKSESKADVLVEIRDELRAIREAFEGGAIEGDTETEVAAERDAKAEGDASQDDESTDEGEADTDDDAIPE